MQRVRKNSLSPCYATSNKENVSIQNISSAIGISFRTLQQARRKKVQQPAHHHQSQQQHSMTYQPPIHLQLNTKKPLINKSLKQQLNNIINPSTPLSNHNSLLPSKQNKPSKIADKTKRDTQKSVDQYRSTLKSKQKQMGSLHSQVGTLNQTILLLREQLNNIKAENKTLYTENIQYKKTMNEKMEIIQKLRKQRNSQLSQPPLPQNNSIRKMEQCQKCKQRQTKDQYQEVIQKLNELQVIQNKLLKQNENLKKKDEMNKAMYKNLKALLQTKKITQATDLLALLIE